MNESDPPWEPPMAGTEAEHLVGMLDRQWATFRWKLDGLDLDGLRFAIPNSQLTPGGLLKHFALVEDDVLCWRIAGDRPVSRFLAPEGVEINGQRPSIRRHVRVGAAAI